MFSWFPMFRNAICSRIGVLDSGTSDRITLARYVSLWRVFLADHDLSENALKIKVCKKPFPSFEVFYLVEGFIFNFRFEPVEMIRGRCQSSPFIFRDLGLWRDELRENSRSRAMEGWIEGKLCPTRSKITGIGIYLVFTFVKKFLFGSERWLMYINPIAIKASLGFDMALPLRVRLQAGHQINEMLLFCSFGEGEPSQPSELILAGGLCRAFCVGIFD